MIGKTFTKPLTDLDGYSEASAWCNKNGAHIEDKGDYYEVVENIVVEPTEDEKKEQRISELKSLLASTDYAVIKIAEGEATKEEYSETLANRKEWREEIRALEGE